MKKNLFLLVFACLLASCSQGRINQDYDASYNFAKLSLYKIEKQTAQAFNGQTIDNDLVDGRIEKAIRINLLMKNFTEVAAGEDMIVRYGYYQKTMLEDNPINTSFGYGWGRGYRSFSGIGIQSGYSINQYEKAVIVIDIIDRATDKLVWRGESGWRMGSVMEPAQVTDAVNRAVAHILANFPPGQNLQ